MLRLAKFFNGGGGNFSTGCIRNQRERDPSTARLLRVREAAPTLRMTGQGAMLFCGADDPRSGDPGFAVQAVDHGQHGEAQDEQ
jgi:hypothetical protein